jgi:DNA-binding MarR family transcriptional regulator
MAGLQSETTTAELSRPATAGGAPRWLDDEEQTTWRAFWLATRLLSESFERDLQREQGLAMSYYEILVQLSEAPERTLRMSELARSSQVSRSALSHAVARLEAAGWVERRDCPTDRRGALATLTDAGFARLERAAPAHVESVRRHLFDQLDPDDRAHLRAISEKLVAHFVAEGTCPPPGAPAETHEEPVP